jgi:hypothetical protein
MNPVEGSIEWMTFEHFGKIASGIFVMVQPSETFEPVQEKFQFQVGFHTC